MRTKDKIGETILTIINDSDEPLETREIEEKLPEETRSKIFTRLKDLRGEGQIKGKMVGAGKGAWIWWKKTWI
jgi:predicted Zn-ribbon and HTH transcriptional regulator